MGSFIHVDIGGTWEKHRKNPFSPSIPFFQGGSHPSADIHTSTCQLTEDECPWPSGEKKRPNNVHPLSWANLCWNLEKLNNTTSPPAVAYLLQPQNPSITFESSANAGGFGGGCAKHNWRLASKSSHYLGSLYKKAFIDWIQQLMSMWFKSTRADELVETETNKNSQGHCGYTSSLKLRLFCLKWASALNTIWN